MQVKDFSGIEKILRTNGVGFIKCFFRSSLYPEDIDYEPTKKWRIDFSDGIKYLGSLDKETNAVGFSTTEKVRPLEYDLYFGKTQTNLDQELKIVLTYTSWPTQGECIISMEGNATKKPIVRKKKVH